jgi:hypothetical protein
MNLTELERKLIAAARRKPLSDKVPYAFEKRVMNYLLMRPVMDNWALWARALWRGAAASLVVMLLLSAVSFLTPVNGVSRSGNDFAQDFEKTLFVAVNQNSDDFQ